MLRALDGQVAWVTGAGSGIGQAAAVALARAGMRLALTGRGRDALERTADLIRGAGGDALVAPADMSVADDVQRAWEAVEAAYKRCDLLVNSAGLNVPERGWSAVTPAGIDAVVGVNLNGPFYASRAVLPAMRAQRRRPDHPGLVLGGPLRLQADGTGLFGGQARAGGALGKSEPGGMRIRDPIVLHLPRRGRDAAPRQATGSRDAGGQGADAAIGGSRRDDPVRRPPAGVRAASTRS